MSVVKVSVVVPVLNGGSSLERCLTSIRRNNGKYKFEIIVVDAGSTDGSIEIAKQYANKVLNGIPHRINRNEGIANAEGEIICFTDSDCIVPEEWIDRLVDGLKRLNEEDDKVVGAGGGNIPLLENPSLEELAISKAMRSPFISFKARNAAIYTKEEEVSHNPPINSALFRWAIEEVGGFREEPGYPEDLDLDAKITGQGYKLYYLPDLLVHHKHKSSFEKFARQMEDFGRKRVRANRVHKHIAGLYHYGPLFLCLMLYSPLFFIPVSMALANALYMSLKEKNLRLFIPITRLTLSFYRNYGIGEIRAFRRNER